MSTTPLTDAAHPIGLQHGGKTILVDATTVEFARSLETRLARLTEIAEGMEKALQPFTGGTREVHPGHPAEDFGYMNKGTSKLVHASLAAYRAFKEETAASNP